MLTKQTQTGEIISTCNQNKNQWLTVFLNLFFKPNLLKPMYYTDGTSQYRC